MKTNTVLSEYSKLLLTIYRQAQDLPVHEFQDGVLSAIKAYLPFDSAMWGTARMTPAGIDIHSLHLHNTTQAMIDAYEKVKHLGLAAVRVTEKPTATIAFNAAEDFPQEEHAGVQGVSSRTPAREFFHHLGNQPDHPLCPLGVALPVRQGPPVHAGRNGTALVPCATPDAGPGHQPVGAPGPADRRRRPRKMVSGPCRQPRRAASRGQAFSRAGADGVAR